MIASDINNRISELRSDYDKSARDLISLMEEAIKADLDTRENKTKYVRFYPWSMNPDGAGDELITYVHLSDTGRILIETEYDNEYCWDDLSYSMMCDVYDCYTENIDVDEDDVEGD